MKGLASPEWLYRRILGSAARELGLYRMIDGSTFRKGLDEGRAVNLSTSVPDFKRRRGCHRVIEYEAVYTEHLSLLTRLSMRVFAWAYNSKIMDRLRCASGASLEGCSRAGF